MARAIEIGEQRPERRIGHSLCAMKGDGMGFFRVTGDVFYLFFHELRSVTHEVSPSIWNRQKALAMIHHPEFTPAPTTEAPGPDLFMAVIKVADWPQALSWYIEKLGLMAVLTDAENQFALLAAGSGRLALQGDPEHLPIESSSAIRLVFLVPDVDEERKRLLQMGVNVGPPFENPREGYREVRLFDPDGTALALFSWTAAAQGERSASSLE
jgi:hypothetical protein